MIDFLTQFLPFSDAGKRVFNAIPNAKIVLTEAQRTAAAEKIILTHTAWASAAGLLPFIRVDVLAVSALQLDMIQQLAEVYGIDFNTTKGKATIASLAGAGFAGSVTKFVRWVPIIGMPIGMATMSILSGATTYALGETFRRHFETGGNFANFETDTLTTFFKDAFERGKKIVEGIDKTKFGQPHHTSDYTYTEVTSEEDILERLHKLNLLRTSGAISETEYTELKKKLIDGV